MGVIETIDNLDKTAVYGINGMQNDVLNHFFITMSDKFLLIPLYALFLFLLYKNYNQKTFFYVLIPSIILIICLCDFTASGIFKPLFARLRPSHAITNLVLPDGKHGLYGFFSSHAANSFGVAMLLFLLLKNKIKYIGFLVFSWAILVSFSRIYLGLHYPTDILMGMTIGILYAYCLNFLIKKWIIKFSNET
jgi:undecaprenyl-diphosphatase